MNLKISFAAAFLLAVPFLPAKEKGTLIFQDDFNRTESQKLKDELGNGWTTSSDTRAHGNKQTDLRNGALYIYIHESADHAVSVRHEFKFRDGVIVLRFMLENPDDTLGLNIADMDCKEVHAGHLIMARVSTTKVVLTDMKTGSMNLVLQAAKKEKRLSAAQEQLLKTKEKTFPHPIAAATWHDLKLEIAGKTAVVSIDGNVVANFASEGFAHPTKGLLRLMVQKNAVVDDLKIYSHDAQ